MAIEIDVNDSGGRCLITPVGQVDLSSSPDLRKVIVKAAKSGVPVSVNLSQVGYMDSSGVATLVEGLQTCSAKKQAFTLVSPSESVLKVLQLARLDTLFTIEDTGGGGA